MSELGAGCAPGWNSDFSVGWRVDCQGAACGAPTRISDFSYSRVGECLTIPAEPREHKPRRSGVVVKPAGMNPTPGRAIS